MAVDEIAETALGEIVRPETDGKKKKSKSKKRHQESAEDVGGLSNSGTKKRKPEEALLDSKRESEQVNAELGSNDEERAAKKRRKEEKRAKKAAREQKASPNIDNNGTAAVPSGDSHESLNGADVQKAEDKARRKADKAARKATKAAKQSKADSEATEVPTAQQSTETSAQDLDRDGMDAATGESTFFLDTTGDKKADKKVSKKREKINQPPSVARKQKLLNEHNAIHRAVEPKAAAHHNHYNESNLLTQLPQSEIDSFLTKNTTTITDPLNLPLRPILDFRQLPSTNLHCKYIVDKFKAPTPIQSASWPFAFASRDLIGVAETGSGKTLAFGLPLARQIKLQPSPGEKIRRQPQALVLTPTRELALQIHEQLEKLAASNNFKVALAYGGVDRAAQGIGLAKAHVLVATPGRLKDFLSMGKYDGVTLERCKYVVLDEADRMLDKGFEDDVKEILGACPSTADGRQTLMYTATWPISIQTLANTYMASPVKITMGNRGEPGDELRANERITQVVEVMTRETKYDRLRELLREHTRGKKKDDRILVFCLYKKEAARVEDWIRNRGFSVGGIHGDLSQSARTAALGAFKEGSVPILVATDVAARGLDIPAVKLVLNYTFPLTVEDYVHRIGRTGRAGQDGLAITFFTEDEKSLAGALVNVLKAAKQEVPEALLKFGGTVKKKGHSLYGAHVKEGMEGMTATKISFD